MTTRSLAVSMIILLTSLVSVSAFAAEGSCEKACNLNYGNRVKLLKDIHAAGLCLRLNKTNDPATSGPNDIACYCGGRPNRDELAKVTKKYSPAAFIPKQLRVCQ